MHFLGRSQIRLRIGHRLQGLQRYVRLQPSQALAAELVEGPQRCLYILVAIALMTLPLGLTASLANMQGRCKFSQGLNTSW